MCVHSDHCGLFLGGCHRHEAGGGLGAKRGSVYWKTPSSSHWTVNKLLHMSCTDYFFLSWTVDFLGASVDPVVLLV